MIPPVEFVSSQFYQQLSKSKVHHLLFWLIYGLFWMYLYSFDSTPINAFVNATVFIFFHGLVSYFNMYVLFSKMLKRKLYVYYVISISLSVLLACFGMAFVFSQLNTIDEESKRSIWDTSFFVTNAISITYTVAITMSLKLVKQWYEREQMTRNLEKINVETELKYLKSQINPHFLFNCLNSLYALTLKKSDLAPDMVLRLSDLLRYLLYEAGEPYVSLEKEIDYLKNYLELEKMRHGDRMHAELNIEGDIAGKKIAPMLFLTFLENSFKHGLAHESESGFLRIVIAVHENDLHFAIANSKPKVKRRSMQGDVGGIGLENVRKRLQLLYPGKHSIESVETEDEYLVNLNLKLTHEYQPEYHEMFNS